jgi:hypothetical protein
MRIEFRRESPKERDHQEDLGVAGRFQLGLIYDGAAWTGLSCLRIGTNGGLFLTWVMNLRIP